MTAFTNYLENEIIKHIFRTGSFVKPSTLYIALFNGVTDGEAGTVAEVSAGSYARVADNPADANWSGSSAGNGTTANAASITFPAATADWGVVTHWGVFDAATAGNLLIYAPLTSPRNITTGSTPSFPAGALTNQVDN